MLGVLGGVLYRVLYLGLFIFTLLERLKGSLDDFLDFLPVENKSGKRQALECRYWNVSIGMLLCYCIITMLVRECNIPFLLKADLFLSPSGR